MLIRWDKYWPRCVSFYKSYSLLTFSFVQEMSNPKVRPHLHFYPEDSGSRLEETRQASKWLNELSPDEATPMIRTRDGDYYVYEPTMLTDGTFCIPYRWFTRNGQFWGRGWAIKPTSQGDPLSEGWVVHKLQEVEFSEAMLLKDFLRLSQDHASFNVPHPSRILGIKFLGFKVRTCLAYFFETQASPPPIPAKATSKNGPTPTQSLGTVGELSPKAIAPWLSLCGPIATTRLATNRRNGINTTVSLSRLQASQENMYPRNTMFIFCVPQTLHPLLK